MEAFRIVALVKMQTGLTGVALRQEYWTGWFVFGRSSVRIVARRSAILIAAFRSFPYSADATEGILPRLGHDRFLRNPFQSIIHQSPCHSTPQAYRYRIRRVVQSPQKRNQSNTTAIRKVTSGELIKMRKMKLLYTTNLVTNLFLRWGVVSPTPNSQAKGSPPIGCPGLLIQCIRSYPSYLEVISSIRSLRTRHAVVTVRPNKQ
jgi:hypothetical protein